jgi:hypothetical protein
MSEVLRCELKKEGRFLGIACLFGVFISLCMWVF